MEAWQKREAEVMEFLVRLHEEITSKLGEEGDIRDDDDILQTAQELIREIVHNLRQDKQPLSLTSHKIMEFARTEAEGMVMMRDLLVMLVQSGFHAAGSKYLHERVHEQGKLYGGHQAMDEVD